MDVAVSEVMVPRIFVVGPGDKVAYVRKVMLGQGIHAVPVFDEEERPLGIVTATDLIDAPHDEMDVVDIMTSEVVTVPQGDAVSVAARVMRTRRLHHLLVTDEDEIVGILSSFDLLKVVEDRGFRVRSSGN
jgi:CBS domain-containing protein